MNTRRISTKLRVGALAFVSVSCSQWAVASDLVIRVSSLSPDLVAIVAKTGQERSIEVSPGTDILKLVTEYCGSANARRYYLPIFLAANAANEDVAAGRTVTTLRAVLKIPACLYANEKFTAVPTGQTGPRWDKPLQISSHVLSRVSEVAKLPNEPIRFEPHVPGSGTIQIAAAQSRLPGQSVDFERLTTGTPLPESLAGIGPELVTQFDSRRLTDPSLLSQYNKLLKSVLEIAGAANNNQLDAATVVRSSAFERAVRTQDVLASNSQVDFSRLLPNAQIVSSGFVPGYYSVTLKDDENVAAAARQIVASLPDAAAAAGASLVSDYVPIFAEAQAADDTSCRPVPGKPWPIDADEIRKVLDLRRRVGQRPITGRLLIFDTGFPRGRVGKPPFDARYFIRRIDDSSGPDAEPYLWTTVPTVYFHDNFKDASHGVGVLTLALGGIDVLKANILPDNVVSQDGQLISLMGYTKRAGDVLDVNGNAVGPTLAGTNWGHVDVVGINLSLKFNLTSLVGPDLGAIIKTHGQILYVFAAGNDGQDLASFDIRPARWGGVQSPNVITVGATTPDGSLWSKSNWSPQFVDIAAPGCGVPTFQWNTVEARFDEVALSGTSFAAPLVSFTGNLLRGNYLSKGAEGIKSRILASGRYAPNLAGKVRSSRILDVPAALAVHFDILRTRGGEMRVGHFEWPPNGRTFCGKVRRRADFAQISVGVGNRINAVLIGDQGTLSFADCSLAQGELANLVFREALPKDDGVELSAAESIDIRTLESITLCERCLWP